MTKKIFVFFFALHIFCFSLVYCYCCPVYAVGGEVGLVEGFNTLMLMLGCSMNLNSDTPTPESWAQAMDATFEEKITGLSSDQIAAISDAYQDFKDNLAHGYMLITDALFDFFKDTTYNDIIVPNENYAALPSSLQPYLGSHYGYYWYFKNLWTHNYTVYDMLICTYKPDNYELIYTAINPPQYVQTWSSSGLDEYRFATAYYGSKNTEWKLNRNGTIDTSYVGSGSVPTILIHPTSTQYPFSYIYYGYYNSTYKQVCNNLVSQIDMSTYEGVIDDVFINDDGIIATEDGTLPQVLDDTTVGDIVDDINAGRKSWASAIGSISDSYPENPAMPEDTLTLPELDQLIADLHLERLQSKFPFCIPHDIQLIYSGATAVSANAPVLVIPIDITFQEHTYFHDDEFITIDFSMFDSIIPIFREGFFLLFLVGLLWVSIHILQAFFVVTE